MSKKGSVQVTDVNNYCRAIFKVEGVVISSIKAWYEFNSKIFRVVSKNAGIFIYHVIHNILNWNIDMCVSKTMLELYIDRFPIDEVSFTVDTVYHIY